MTSKKLKSLVYVVFTTLLLLACKSKNLQSNPTEMHKAQNSLDWIGSYSGNLPCADCDYIETELTLKKDQTYLLTSKYVGKDSSRTFNHNGNFSWKENKIKLENVSKNERPSMFKIEENRVRQLDMNGNEITGEFAKNYILKKNGNPSIEDKKWQLIELNGKTVNGTPENHYIIFHSKDNKLEAKANCNVMLNSYKIKNEFKLEIKLGISTLMACPDNLEKELVQVFSKADNLSTDGKTLSLNKARMAPLARFQLVTK